MEYPFKSIEDAHQFGVMEIDAKGRLVSFQEKPAQPKHMPGDPSRALVSAFTL